MTTLIIQARVNERQMRSAIPHVPYNPEEFAEDVVARWKAGAPLETPPLAALLTAYELRPSGGDTIYAAYDALSPDFKSLLDNPYAVNSNFRLPFPEPREFTHPAVIADPLTGRKSPL
jgi:hypothetical protein